MTVYPRRRLSAAAEVETPVVPAPRETPASPRMRRFDRVPRWVWILAFLVPVGLSEFMFHMVGKTPEMILFPVAWIGFWIALMQRSGWAILKRRKEESGSES